MENNSKLFEKPLWEDCPECGGTLVAKTMCDPAKDTDDDVWFMDCDEVFCKSCDFTAKMSCNEKVACIDY